MAEKLNIALIGLGTHMLRGHYLPLLNNPSAEVIAGFDPSSKINSEFSVKRVATENDIFEDPKVDAVIVGSPDRFHISALEKAVQHGKHALIDKPLADSKDALDKLNSLLFEAKERGLIISSCHPRRFDPPYIWLKDNLDGCTEELGRPLELRLDFFYHKPSKQGLYAGLLSDHFNHEIDFLNFLFSTDPFTAYKLFDNQVQYSAAGIRDDGISFHFFGNRALDSRTYHEQVAVRFEKGYLKLNTGLGELLIENYNEQRTRFAATTRTDYERRFYDLNNNFVEACLGESKLYLSNQELIVNTQAGIELTDSGVYRFNGE